MYLVDLNSDLGEAFGRYSLGRDEEVLSFITSANIACGFHASDPDVMARTVDDAVKKDVCIGAHPGMPDLMGFGRRELKVSPEEAGNLVTYQLGALEGFLHKHRVKLKHVKPHGALYNMAAKDPALSRAITRAVQEFDPELILMGLAGSELVKAAKSAGLKYANEFFSDRAYEEDGTLVSRRKEGAMVTDEEEAIRRVIRAVQEKKVTAITGRDIPITADSICIHGDGVKALEFASRIRQALIDSGIQVVPLTEVVANRDA